jgi:predicted exporter
MVDSRSSHETLGTTLVSLLLSCVTTIFVFGVMGFSAHPALHAIGRTAGVGIALSFLLAPVALALVGPERSSEINPS